MKWPFQNKSKTKARLVFLGKSKGANSHQGIGTWNCERESNREYRMKRREDRIVVNKKS